MAAQFLHRLRRLPVYRLLALPFRARIAVGYPGSKKSEIASWLFRSREDTNFTYDLDARNVAELVAMVAMVTGATAERVSGLISELEQDSQFRANLQRIIDESDFRHCTDPPRYARRVGWYATARILKPKVIIETGIDKGLGAAVLAAALERNAMEGHPGHYYGFDINPEAGWMLTPSQQEFAHLIVGDAVSNLKIFDQVVDLFINDSDHRTEYEASEYDTIERKLAPHAIILGDNSHESRALESFCDRTGRQYAFFQERPADHWYPGAGIGFGYTSP